MLSVQVYSDATGMGMLADWSTQISAGWGGGGLSFGTNRHGFSALTLPLVRLLPSEAFAAYGWQGTPHLVVSDAATGTVWEGRIEDVAIVPGGLTVHALGYQRALYDGLYSAMWSVSSVAGWQTVTNDNISSQSPERYTMDTNNRLYIAPNSGETFGDGTHAGAMTLAVPHRSGRLLQTFGCSYEMTLPSGWSFRVVTYDDAFTGSSTVNTVTATGSAQTGTLSLSLGGKARVNVDIRNNTGGNSTISDETGTYYLKLTNVRVKTTSASTVLGSAIVAALAEYVAGENGTQLLATAAEVEATTTDLRDVVYEDVAPATILDELATLHGYEWGVYENRQLYWRRRVGVPGRRWFVDVTRTPEIERSLEQVRNAAYGVHQDAAGNTRRTTTATDAGSILRYGIRRTGAVDVQTTSATQAEVHRDVFLADNADAQARARIEFDGLYDAAGGQWPLWSVRSGDSITMRNLPPTLGEEIESVRTFRVGETEYDAGSGTVTVTPDEPTPTLVTLVARRGAGL